MITFFKYIRIQLLKIFEYEFDDYLVLIKVIMIIDCNHDYFESLSCIALPLFNGRYSI